MDIILASASPRRKELLSTITQNFIVKTSNVEEIIPEGMSTQAVAEYLANLKANAVFKTAANALVIGADTIVVKGNRILGKPKNREEAIEFISLLADTNHQVITGVSILGPEINQSFSVSTEVYFTPLSDQQIAYYVDEFRPYDKAGAYAIQEWIGQIGIHRIDGDFYNVVGLPVSALFEQLKSLKILS